MALSSRLRAPKAFCARSDTNRVAVIVHARKSDAIQSPRAQAPGARLTGAALLAAAALALNVAPSLGPQTLLLQPAQAEEDVSEELLTPYQRRQRELERRREVLRQAREQAEMKAGGEVAAPSSAEADAAIEAANAGRRAAADALSSELKTSAAAAYESSTSGARYRGFGGFGSTPAPPPAVESKPAPVVEVKKSAPTPAKKMEEPKKEPAGKQKRRGPLPLFAAEVLVIGGFAGIVLAFTKYAEQTNKVLALAGEKGKELFSAAEQVLAKAQQAK